MKERKEKLRKLAESAHIPFDRIAEEAHVQDLEIDSDEGRARSIIVQLGHEFGFSTVLRLLEQLDALIETLRVEYPEVAKELDLVEDEC